jgi:hypothetical protein
LVKDQRRWHSATSFLVPGRAPVADTPSVLPVYLRGTGWVFRFVFQAVACE